MTDDDYDALSQKQLASIKRDMRISLEDAAVRATYKVMAELETEQNQGEEHMTQQEIQELAGHREVPPWVVKLVADAVAKEREACAKVCEELVIEVVGNSALAVDQCTRAIRARGQA